MLTAEWNCGVCKMLNRGRDDCAGCGTDKGVQVIPEGRLTNRTVRMPIPDRERIHGIPYVEGLRLVIREAAPDGVHESICEWDILSGRWKIDGWPMFPRHVTLLSELTALIKKANA